MKLIIVNSDDANVVYCRKLNESDIRGQIIDAVKNALCLVDQQPVEDYVDIDDMVEILTEHYSNYWIDDMYNFRIVEIDD